VIPLIVAGAVLFVGAVASGIVAVVLLWPDRKVNEPAPLLVDAGAKPAEAAPPAKLPDEAVERVKRATVYIRVTMAGPRGQVIGSGSGFLLTRDGHLITNSHVISPPPEMPGLRIRKIEVVFHSGEPNSFTADATVIRSDPGPDLALLRVLPHSLPEPVPLGDSTGLRETHDVYIFGFPLGERLGKSITVSKSSVSSLRRDRPWPEIQVNGGMHPGNSGGPVTDAHGRVVGVAVAGIVGTQLNFAIPSETVRTFLQSAVKGDPVVGGAPLPPVGDPGVGLPAVNDPPPRPAPRPPAAKVETPAGTRATQILGGTFDREYHDVGPEGSLLVGLEIGLGTFINYDVIRAVRPIYRGGGKETFGKQRGTELDCIVKVVARPGYAVGAISIKSGLGLDSLSITFMKVVDGKLDRLDTYESERIGGPGGGGPVKVGGDGSPVVGIVGKENDQHATGLGLLLGPKPKPPPEPPGVRDTAAAGGAFAREDYREVQSDGAILIGFELGLGKVFNTDIISYLRPIWLGPKGERMGMPYGKRPTAPTIVKAKEGYALAGVVVRGGGALEGICFTFMRIGKSGLDTTDAYTSEWFGEQKRKPRPSELQAGDGSKVVGIHGKRFEDRGGDRYNDGGAIGTIGLVLAPKEK
jgi:S1-C subfamily serine protease